MIKRTIVTIKLTLCFLFCLACSNSSKLENIQNKQIIQATPIPTITPKIEIKPLINFFLLANKSVAEIENIYGKHIFVDTKSIQLKTEKGEFRHYRIFKDIKNDLEDLQVDYFKGKAVGLYINIPKDFQLTSIEKTIKLCGFDLEVSGAQIGGTGEDYWWDKPAKAEPFYSIHIRKFRDSGLFYNCEAQIRVK